MPNIGKTHSYGLKVTKPRPKRPSVKKPLSYPHLRELTVSLQHVERKRYWNTWESIPFLKLTGKWLEEAGFPIDCKVDVIVDRNRLVIQPSELPVVSIESTK